MKTYFTTILIYWFSMTTLLSQNVYNSNDVKLKAPLKQNWVYKADNIILSQNIVDKVCYLNTLSGISAVSLVDGKELWKHKYPTEPVIPSVVTLSDKFAVYITYNFDIQTESGMSTAVLVDLTTGKEKWSQKSQEIWYKPTLFLDDKKVYCIAGPPDDWEENKDYFKMELDRATLVAFSIEDGKVLWQQDLWDNESNLIKVEGDYLFTIHDFDVSDTGQPKNKLSCFSIVDGLEKWEYNPSGMITKAFIGNVIIKNNVVYAFPSKGSTNSVSAIDLEDGNELWQNTYIAFDAFYFRDDKLITFGDGSSKTGKLVEWYASELKEGEKYFKKTIFSSGGLGFLFSELFAKSIFGKIANVVTGYGGLFSSLLGNNEGAPPLIIPTSSLFSGLSNTSVMNDKGLFAIYKDDDISILNIMSTNLEDDKKIEYKLSESSQELILANGTAPTSVFITYGGNVASINLKDGKQEWSKSFAQGSSSLGLIIKDDKILLFTTDSVFQLQNE